MNLVKNISIWLAGLAVLLVLTTAAATRAAILYSGDLDPSDPTTWTSDTTAYIGKTDTTDPGQVEVNDGSSLLSRRGYLGYDSGTSGTVTIDGAGSTWTNDSSLHIGRYGAGTLSITDGGAVSNSYSYVGDNSGSTGEVVVDGASSTWTNNSSLVVGHAGAGVLSITNNGAVSNSYSYVGNNSGSTGEVVVDGANSTWTNSSSLVVGYAGAGVLSITNGGAVSNSYGYVGNNSGSTGEVVVDGAGATWTNSGNLYVGYNGDGVLSITQEGLVSVAGTLTVDYDADGNGAVRVASGGMLALAGAADGSLAEFLALVEGTDSIRYWDSDLSGWADIHDAVYGEDYTLEYLTTGDLAGHTLLTVGTVPEPATLVMFLLGPVVVFRRLAV